MTDTQPTLMRRRCATCSCCGEHERNGALWSCASCGALNPDNDELLPKKPEPTVERNRRILARPPVTPAPNATCPQCSRMFNDRAIPPLRYCSIGCQADAQRDDALASGIGAAEVAAAVDGAVAGELVPAAKRCDNPAPRSHGGHWREWHRGHGCELDDTAKSNGAPTPASSPPAMADAYAYEREELDARAAEPLITTHTERELVRRLEAEWRGRVEAAEQRLAELTAAAVAVVDSCVKSELRDELFAMARALDRQAREVAPTPTAEPDGARVHLAADDATPLCRVREQIRTRQLAVSDLPERVTCKRCLRVMEASQGAEMPPCYTVNCHSCEMPSPGTHAADCPTEDARQQRAASPPPDPQPAALTAEQVVDRIWVDNLDGTEAAAIVERYGHEQAGRDYKHAVAAKRRVADLERQLAEAQRLNKQGSEAYREACRSNAKLADALAEAQQRAAAGERVREAAQALATAVEELHIAALPRCEACGADIPETELWPVMMQACQRTRQALAAAPVEPGGEVAPRNFDALVDDSERLCKARDEWQAACSRAVEERDSMRRELEAARAEVERLLLEASQCALEARDAERDRDEVIRLARALDGALSHVAFANDDHRKHSNIAVIKAGGELRRAMDRIALSSLQPSGRGDGGG